MISQNQMQEENEKREKLDKMERKLYSRKTPNAINKGRTGLTDESEEETDFGKQSEGWQDAKTSGFDQLAAKMSRVAEKRHSFFKKIFGLSIAFFVVAALVAGFVFWGGMNLISSRNVDIQVVGPLSIAGGQETSFDINIINNNNTDLESAALVVEYPEGTRSAIDLSIELQRERFTLDVIKAGATYNQNIKAAFFGNKDTLKQIKISLEYRVENSSALFYKEKVHEVSISSSPVIITPTYPKEVNSNQEISFNIEVASNSKEKINNFLVNLEYPFGFVFKEALPSASFGNNVWKFSSLNSGEKKTIKIIGSIIGQDNEERVFRINAGTADSLDERIIAVPLAQLMESVLVKKPFVGVDVLISGNSGDFVAQGGKEVNTELVIRNNLPSILFNTSVAVSFKGGAFDGTTVSPGNAGFFQSFNNTILWDKRSVAEFSEMGPGSERRLSFRLSSLLYSKIASGAKPEIEITVTVKGERILESGSAEQVTATETRKILLATDIIFSSRVVRSIGNLENSGPIPPKPDIPTTYTIIWNIKNSFNQISNAEVRATLPAYVKWTDVHSPFPELISFNEATNEIVWNAGSILPNTGFNSSKKEVYFQLEFLPSTSQIGQAPVILSGASLSGLDKITGVGVGAKAAAMTTNFSGDPTFKQGDDKVGE